MPERERRLYPEHQPIQLERFRDEVVGAPRTNFAFEVGASVACHHDDRHVGIGHVKTVEDEFTRDAG